MVENLPATQEPQRTQVQSLGWEDPLEEKMANCSLQYSFLENSMDRGAWWATVHSVTKSWTQLKQLSTHTHGVGEERNSCFQKKRIKSSPTSNVNIELGIFLLGSRHCLWDLFCAGVASKAACKGAHGYLFSNCQFAEQSRKS